MHFFRIMHGIVAWCQEDLPFTVDDQDVVVVAARTIPQAIVDILQANNIIGDGALVIATAMQGDPDLVLFAVHLFFNCLQAFGTVTQDVHFIVAHLYLAADNNHRVLDPQLCCLFIGAGKDGDADGSAHVFQFHHTHGFPFFGSDAPCLANHTTERYFMFGQFFADEACLVRDPIFHDVAQVG